MQEWVKLSGIENPIRKFAKIRHDGAKKIADSAKEKGGPAILTYHHFVVKLPFYQKTADGHFDKEKMKEEYVKTCQEIHNFMDNVENVNQVEFQKIVGKLEVIGELLIKNKDK
jgi:hypothetical protein